MTVLAFIVAGGSEGALSRVTDIVVETFEEDVAGAGAEGGLLTHSEHILLPAVFKSLLHLLHLRPEGGGGAAFAREEAVPDTTEVENVLEAGVEGGTESTELFARKEAVGEAKEGVDVIWEAQEESLFACANPTEESLCVDEDDALGEGVRRPGGGFSGGV